MSITITNATFVQNGSFSWLLLHLVQAKEAAGKYVCVATNTQGTTVSWEGTVNVLSDPGNLGEYAGSNASLLSLFQI